MTSDRVVQKSFFGFGLLVFLIGLIGAFFLWQQEQAVRFDEFYDDTAYGFFDVDLNKKSAQRIRELFPEADWRSFFPEYISRGILESDVAAMSSWIGDRVSVAFFPKGEMIVGAKFRKASQLEAFLERFTLDSESFEKEEYGPFKIWTPEYSSSLAIGFWRRRVFFASSKDILLQNIQATAKLSHSDKYKAIYKDFQDSSVLFAFVDTQTWVEESFDEGKRLAEKPLWQAMASLLSATGVSATGDDEALSFRFKFLSHEGIFENRPVVKIPEQTLPELARLVPKDTLFFLNGSDLYAKYLHTKQFLTDLHPQFGLVFEGILRAQSKEVFGDGFDFETDFLASMHGQYAIVLDYQEAAFPFLNFTFLTEFGGANKAQHLSQIHDAVQHAQARFTTRVAEVMLPDGTVREELVSEDLENVPLEKKMWEGHEYFTTLHEAAEKQFSYGFVENYLIFSLREEGVRSVLGVKNGYQPSLVENEDLRESVLFRYSPSESYGFVNMAKLSSAIDFVFGTEDEHPSWVVATVLKNAFRNMTFARKVYKKEIFWDATLFAR